MKHATLLLFLSLITLPAMAQQITGTVMDSELNEPLPFVNIQLTENKGTITNVEGTYRLDVDGFDENHMVKFSYMGFEDFQVSVATLMQNSTVVLKPSNELLDQVVVSNKQLTALEIIEKFKENREDNHQLGSKRYRLFRRNRTTFEPEQMVFELKKASNLGKKERQKINRTMQEINDELAGSKSLSFTESLRDLYTKDSLMVDMKKKIFLADSDVKKDMEEYQEEAIKRLFANFNSPYGFKIKLGLITLTDSVDISSEEEEGGISISNTNEDEEESSWNSDVSVTDYPELAYTSEDELPDVFLETKKYNFELLETTFINNRPQYRISFSPRRSGAKYSGQMYIDQEDYAVTQIDYQLADGKSAFKLNLKLIGIKVDAFKAEKSIRFVKNEEGFYVPYYANYATGSYVFLRRTLTFIENNPNRSERIKFKLRFVIELVNQDATEWVLTEQENLEGKAINYSNFSKKVETEVMETYDPSVWKEYAIFEATQEMKEYNFSKAEK